MNYNSDGLAWGNKTGIDTIWGDAVEANFVDASTIHIDLDCQKEMSGPNPEVDIDFDLHFSCVHGIVQLDLKNLVTKTNFVGDVQKFIRGKIPEIIGQAINLAPDIGPIVAPIIQGRLASFLAFSLNVSIDSPNISQICALINVTQNCDIMLH